MLEAFLIGGATGLVIFVVLAAVVIVVVRAQLRAAERNFRTGADVYRSGLHRLPVNPTLHKPVEAPQPTDLDAEQIADEAERFRRAEQVRKAHTNAVTGYLESGAVADSPES